MLSTQFHICPPRPFFSHPLAYACRRRQRLREAKPLPLKHPKKQQLLWRQQ